MTQEEYEQEQREIERLVHQINALIAENNAMVDEINNALTHIWQLQRNVVQLHKNVDPLVKHVSGEVSLEEEKVKMVDQALEELSAQYFTFKTLSTASKNLSQYTDEYYTRFSYYEHLRRVTLGFVIGLDKRFVSDESLCKAVEKAYLQNTQYWLAYCTMAVMLWAGDKREAAQRALDKALFINPSKASLFFMLINLRFARTAPAQQWFVSYMDRLEASNVGEEFQYLLQAYLTGAMGSEPQFQEAVGRCFQSLLAQTEATTVEFARKFSDGAFRFAASYLHRTQQVFVHLKANCQEFGLLDDLLSAAEKNAVLTQFYGELAAAVDQEGETIAQRIENVLYSLVSSYDADELEVVKKIKYNEAVIAAQGDISAAQKKFEQDFGAGRKQTFGDLLVKWAFASDRNLTPLSVQRFSISFMQEAIARGFGQFAQSYRASEPQTCSFQIDGCSLSCTEHDFEPARQQVEQYYRSNRLKFIFADKFSLIFAGLILLGLLTLVFTAVAFTPVALTIGLLLVLAGVFLLWRRIVELGAVLKEKQRLSVEKLRSTLEELGQWRTLFHQEDQRNDDLVRAIEQFQF